MLLKAALEKLPTMVVSKVAAATGDRQADWASVRFHLLPVASREGHDAPSTHIYFHLRANLS